MRQRRGDRDGEDRGDVEEREEWHSTKKPHALHSITICPLRDSKSLKSRLYILLLCI